MSRLAGVILCLLVSGTSMPSEPGYEAGPVDARIVSGPDEDGELLISIKVMVRNDSDADLDFEFKIQACDNDEFEVAEFELEGQVKARTTKSITDTDYIKPEVFNSISTWNIEEVEASESPDESVAGVTARHDQLSATPLGPVSAVSSLNVLNKINERLSRAGILRQEPA
jgi:hypothetical protein